jgi:hypothetical protein
VTAVIIGRHSSDSRHVIDRKPREHNQILHTIQLVDGREETCISWSLKARLTDEEEATIPIRD